MQELCCADLERVWVDLVEALVDGRQTLVLGTALAEREGSF